MTQEEIDEITEKIHKGMLMVIEKAEQVGKDNTKWSASEIIMMSDIVKDMAESLKDLAKTHALLTEHSVKKY